jgi:hypothetical protein
LGVCDLGAALCGRDSLGRKHFLGRSLWSRLGNARWFNRRSMSRRTFSSTLSTAALAVLALSGDSAQAQSSQALSQAGQLDGPAELIITYRCPPPRRAAFRQFITESGIRRFEQWKQDGVLKDYRFLFNWYVDVDTWDAMAVLSFTSYAQVARWKEIEHASPGGLIRDALELAWPLNTTSADLMSYGVAEEPGHVDSRGADFGRGAPAASVYWVIPYDAANAGLFRDFVNGNLLTQVKAWMHDGLASYRIYSNRYPGGKRWQGLLVLEFKDMDAFSHAKSLPKDARATERESVMADAVVVR